MTKKRFDNIWLGMLLGAVGAVAGFFGFAWYWCLRNNETLTYYIDEIFMGTDFFQDKILTISILVDVLIFALFMKMQYYQTCKGILAFVLLSLPFIFYFH